MENQQPILSQILSWPLKPLQSGTVKLWLLGLVFISIVGFMWSTVLADIKS